MQNKENSNTQSNPGEINIEQVKRRTLFIELRMNGRSIMLPQGDYNNWLVTSGRLEKVNNKPTSTVSGYWDSITNDLLLVDIKNYLSI